VICPYCGEANEIAVDAGGGAEQDYVEDCQVCCRPYRATITYTGGRVQVTATPLDD
jgi:hypothetical protein